MCLGSFNRPLLSLNDDPSNTSNSELCTEFPMKVDTTRKNVYLYTQSRDAPLPWRPHPPSTIVKHLTTHKIDVRTAAVRTSQPVLLPTFPIYVAICRRGVRRPPENFVLLHIILLCIDISYTHTHTHFVEAAAAPLPRTTVKLRVLYTRQTTKHHRQHPFIQPCVTYTNTAEEQRWSSRSRRAAERSVIDNYLTFVMVPTPERLGAHVSQTHLT